MKNEQWRDLNVSTGARCTANVPYSVKGSLPVWTHTGFFVPVLLVTIVGNVCSRGQLLNGLLFAFFLLDFLFCFISQSCMLLHNLDYI